MPKSNSKKIENVPKEIINYPETDFILYTDGRRSYNYMVKQEGLYPQPPILTYTQGKIKYKIPDHYCVETTWGRGKNKRTVKCSIIYIEGKPLFKIMYGVNFSENIQSNISSTTVANAVLKVNSLKIFLNQIKCYHNIKFYYFQKLFPLNENSLILGIHIFRIHLITLKKARESVKENHIQLI